MTQLRKEHYNGEPPFNHAADIWFNPDDTIARRHDWNDYNHAWDYKQEFQKIGDKNVSVYSKFEGEGGDYQVHFDFYPNGELKMADLSTPHGHAKLYYNEDGKLETLEKREKGKTKTFHYTYEDGKEPTSIFSAQGMYERYAKNQWIDRTGGYESVDWISSLENFAKLRKEYGVLVTSDEKAPQRKKERPLSDEERAAAFAFLGTREIDSDVTRVYGRLEKTKSDDHLIGSDIKALDNGLVAVARMYRHSSWERGDAGWTPHGNGEQWDYELDGAIVDLEKKKVVASANFSQKVRDSYDGSKDTHQFIDLNTMIKEKGKKVEFFMGDKYHTVASQEVDIDTALKLLQAKERIKGPDKPDAPTPPANGNSVQKGGKPTEYEL